MIKYFKEAAGADMNDTIAAIATPLAEGAISIIRVSGEQAISIVQSLFDHDLFHRDANTITYGFIKKPNTNTCVDEVLVSLFRMPHSFTGEDVIEINCHGGVFITREILKLVLSQGARLARPGEFSERAFLHGRIDLAQAEAVMDMVKASDSTNAQMAIQGIRGSVQKLLKPLIEEILNIIAVIEVNIDYPEYDDVEIMTTETLLPSIEAWLKNIAMILDKAESGRILKEGIKTAIIGKPNVGKSSLLNALLEEEKAIVTDIEGTTRDIVEGSIHLGGITLHLIDTAGIRKTDDVIEQMGIERSQKAIDEAQLILLIIDASKEMDEQDHILFENTKHKNRLIVYNKSDLADTSRDGISICAANNEIDELLSALQKLYEHHQNVANAPILNNDRQIGLMRSAQKHMEQAKMALLAGMEPNIVELDIQEAYKNLKEILGEYHRDDLLDTLFANFCLGK